jgi:hypothetical protein
MLSLVHAEQHLTAQEGFFFIRIDSSPNAEINISGLDGGDYEEWSNQESAGYREGLQK